MKKEKGFLDVNIIKRFPSQFPEISFLGYVSNLVNVEKFIATAGVLAPPLIEEDGGVYLKEHYPLIQKYNLYERFNYNIKEIERYTNLISLWDFYTLAYDKSVEDEYLFYKFVETIRNFWQMYLHFMYPEKEFEIEISEKGFFEEDNLCMTFSQQRRCNG